MNKLHMCLIHAFINLVEQIRENLNMKPTPQSSLVRLVFKLSCASIQMCMRPIYDKGMCIRRILYS